MNENTAKLNMLRKEIETCSDNEADAIIKNAEAEAAEVLEELEKKLEAEQGGNIRRITDAFRNDEKKRVSEARFSEGRRVLMHRGKLVDEFFGEVEEKLKLKTAAPEYKAYLLGCIKKAEGMLTLDEGVRVLCREADIADVNVAIKGYSCTLEADNSIKFGGIRVSCPEKGIVIDLTLDSALENERENFSSLKEMQI